MRKVKLNNSIFILIGIAAVLIVSQLFAETFNDFFSYSQSISNEYHLLKAQKSDGNGEESFSIAQITSYSDIFGYEKPFKPSDKTLTSTKLEDDDNAISSNLTKNEQSKETLKEKTESFQLQDNKVLASDALKNDKSEKSSSDVRVALNKEKKVIMKRLSLTLQRLQRMCGQ